MEGNKIMSEINRGGGYDEDKHLVTLLWSGGWDGTFRLLQLAENDIKIQPIYVIDSERRSNANEIDAMHKIIKQISKNRMFKAEICDIVYYKVEWILENCQDNEISENFKYLREKYKIGAQYEWFSLLCKKLHTKMESSVVHQYHGKVEDAIREEGILALIENDFLDGRFHVLPKNGIKTVYTVFENIILPVINLSKEDEWNIAKEKGWMDIMELSWFCHSPINGKPCGLCGPCDDAMNTGMEWRMPKEAKNRYKHRKLFRYINRFKGIIKSVTG
jgi:7-cyano-7-deazaguanine synthase